MNTDIAIASVNPAIERLLVVDRNRPGSVHRLARSETLAGGKGVNVARVLAILATEPPVTPVAHPTPHLFGFAGGPTGRLLRDLLDAEGLAADLVTTRDATRVCEVLVDLADPDGATVYNAKGADVDKTELDALDEAFDRAVRDARALVCTGSLPPGAPDDLYARWIEAAPDPVLTVLDAHGPALAAGVRARPDVVKVNAEELAAVSDVGGSTLDTARAWREWGVGCVIVTDGPRPTLALTPNGTYEVIAPDVPTRSAVGSGDAFCAGLVHSLTTAADRGWGRHLRVAAACGASNAASLTAGQSSDHPAGSLYEQVIVRRIDG
ncbi:1-phosphofructokinase family hexose kinase [Streptomyces sp. NPDC102381]|uniref:1-phosphofructokinase family hexose kinase n=1 Tax=Streptomyces sp. NPDC102381 TaxID=3366164 RepID=UPI003813A6EE